MDAVNRLQIFGYLTKPWSFEHLKETISKAFQHYNLIAENKRLQQLTQKQNQQISLVNENLEDMVRKRTSQLEEAIREGKLAVELLAVSKDAVRGTHRIEDLARIYVMIGEYDKAIDQLEFLLSIPSRISIPMLGLDPTWDPLRDMPRFQRLLKAKKNNREG